MTARKKKVRTDALGYRVLDGKPPVEVAAAKLTRKVAVEEIQEILSFGSGLTWQAKRRISELLTALLGEEK